ncbi:chaplin family protein [Nocardiopsis ganjiahuensis]|uniref:chaplin family protein n=1 Tax=Nocardiopsis ganjiahuensis TaxID=239984 RepID=UPI0003482D2A|nr:chaplin family protein [Nocardiopsis ganjiahuensis]
MTQTTHIRFAALVAAGFFAASHGIAYADTTTSGNGSIGGGNQVELDVDAPINVCGNAVAVLGVAGADCTDSDAKVTKDSSTNAPHPGYEGYDPEEPEEEPREEEPEEEEPEEEEPAEESPEEEAPEEEEEEEEREEQLEEETPSPEPSESASPSAPAADEQRLAVTGADQSALAGLLAAAVLAVAAGAGLLLFGKRRRTRA